LIENPSIGEIPVIVHVEEQLALLPKAATLDVDHSKNPYATIDTTAHRNNFLKSFFIGIKK
jgi:hypothetical protein